MLNSLRQESSVEANTVNSWLNALGTHSLSAPLFCSFIIGVRHDVLRVQWRQVPTTKIMETSRQKRYELMDDMCRRRGIRQLFVAHQLEDQVRCSLHRVDGVLIRSLVLRSWKRSC